MKNSGNNILLTGTGQQFYKKAKKLIPGGTQLLSKRPEMFAPDVWPAYYSKAKGCKVWDRKKDRCVYVICWFRYRYVICPVQFMLVCV